MLDGKTSQVKSSFSGCHYLYIRVANYSDHATFSDLKPGGMYRTLVLWNLMVTLAIVHKT